MKLKSYSCSYFGDYRCDNDNLFVPRLFQGEFTCLAPSWRVFLLKLYNKFLSDVYVITNAHIDIVPFDLVTRNVTLGLAHNSLYCEGKPIDFNYINRVISKDDDLKEMFYY